VKALINKLLKRLVKAGRIDPDEAEAAPDEDIESVFDVICQSLKETKSLGA